jgi:formamidopyrimidine-DNA glycosylase
MIEVSPARPRHGFVARTDTGSVGTMPELPEVETVRTQLEPGLAGRTFAHVEILDGRLTRPEDPVAVAAELQGERVAELRRRGKYLIVGFASGRTLLVHLRMTGGFTHPAQPHAHRRAEVLLDDGTTLAYSDTRRFGTWLVLEPGRLEPYLEERRIGVEPLSSAFTTKRFAAALAGRRAPIKAALLDQRAVAGVGNIYADEALWRAKLNPLVPAGELDRRAVGRLRTSVREALEVGIARQGATLRDYRAPDGANGSMQLEFRVYGREGEPCDRCGTPIEKIRTAGRGTWFCPRCQPAPAGARPAGR